jgi:hypothetical protein
VVSKAFSDVEFHEARRADTRPLGRVPTSRAASTGGGLDTLLRSYLNEDDTSPNYSVRPSVDTPIPLAPGVDGADGSQREFWSFRRAFAHQARLGRTVPTPSSTGMAGTRKRGR